MANETLKELIPQEVSNLDIAFPAESSRLMPRYTDIPDEFKRAIRHDKWRSFFNDWFYRGIKDLKTVPKEGIDSTKAIRHLAGFIGSFEPKHEHKEAAFRYLASLWFDDVSYNVRKVSGYGK